MISERHRAIAHLHSSLHMLMHRPESVEITVGGMVVQVDEPSQVNPPSGEERGAPNAPRSSSVTPAACSAPVGAGCPGPAAWRAYGCCCCAVEATAVPRQASARCRRVAESACHRALLGASAGPPVHAVPAGTLPRTCDRGACRCSW